MSIGFLTHQCFCQKLLFRHRRVVAYPAAIGMQFSRSKITSPNGALYNLLTKAPYQGTVCRRLFCGQYLGMRVISVGSLGTNADHGQKPKHRNISNSTKENKEMKISQSHKNRLLQNFGYIVNTFWSGCKALFKDILLALRTRKKLGLYYQQDLSKLSREELRHMRQTRKDVVKTFPVTLLFMVPFIGYIAPIIAYIFPKQLLSKQFWHPDQEKAFVLEEYEKRSQYYLPLIKEVGLTCKEIKDKQLLYFCYTQVLDGKHPTNEDLLKFKETFTQHEDFSLKKMPRYHLVKLCRCWLIPTGWYLPRWFLMNALMRRVVRLHEDDSLIQRDGIDSLTPACIAHAVHVRGLDDGSLKDGSKIEWLCEWVKLSSQVASNEISFLAHSAVFKAANFERARQKKTDSQLKV